MEIIRTLSILNIFLNVTSSQWGRYLRYFLNETENIFKKKDYLNNKDKIMILINYVSIINSECPEYKQYQFESFYELNEDSFFVKSELFYRKIISKLTDESSLFFLYLQLDSGSGLDFVSRNHFYKIKHISLTKIKIHLLTENFYPFFFIFIWDKKLLAWNDGKTQVKNYNLNYQIYSEEDFFESKFLVNNTVKLTIIKLHEYAHTKFKGDYQLKISPRYLLIDNLDFLNNKKKIVNESKIPNELTDNFGESDQAIDRYIFGDELIINNIVYSMEKDLSKLYNSDLFTQNNFNDLNKLTEYFKPSINEKFDNKNPQTKLGKNQKITIQKLNIKKYGNTKLLTYYDLNISSTDLI